MKSFYIEILDKEIIHLMKLGYSKRKAIQIIYKEMNEKIVKNPYQTKNWKILLKYIRNLHNFNKGCR